MSAHNIIVSYDKIIIRRVQSTFMPSSLTFAHCHVIPHSCPQCVVFYLSSHRNRYIAKFHCHDLPTQHSSCAGCVAQDHGMHIWHNLTMLQFLSVSCTLIKLDDGHFFSVRCDDTVLQSREHTGRIQCPGNAIALPEPEETSLRRSAHSTRGVHPVRFRSDESDARSSVSQQSLVSASSS